ncbi:MAG: AgmX/PglI C-terminal domain-containing protein [Gammaproteobacteria bacterium]|nr:AgmX/PglI C-terminal domain-containing protein [Gammaproteobacteria bacterium]
MSQEQQKINQKIELAHRRIAELENDLHIADADLDLLFVDRPRFVLLSELADRLDKLNKLGGASMFWGDGCSEKESQENYQRVYHQVVNYDEKVREVQMRREQIKDDIQSVIAQINILKDDFFILHEREEERKNEFVIEREMTRHPFRPMILPWTTQGEDEKRFRRILFIILFFTFVLSWLTAMYDLPIPDRDTVVEIPERLAKLLVEKEPPPPPPPPPEEKKPEEPKEKVADKPKPTDEKTVARKKAESTGLLAFSKDFSELMDSSDLKLGTQAQITNKGQKSAVVSRSLVTSQAGTGSSGINTASLSRDVGGGGKGIGGVSFSRVESAIGADYAGDERPLSDGPGPSRTDEEIQIVFDRYKAALYRIYNRKLRDDPTLQGKIVLRIIIEPDGSVSLCKMESSDLKTPDLEADIVDRVKKINFGAKAGVPKITILYPIDFLPSS